MSAINCSGCNRITNTVTSNWMKQKDYIPTECYVAWDKISDDKFIAVLGCAFNKPGRNIERDFYQNFADEWNKNNKEINKWQEK